VTREGPLVGLSRTVRSAPGELWDCSCRNSRMPCLPCSPWLPCSPRSVTGVKPGPGQVEAGEGSSSPQE